MLKLDFFNKETHIFLDKKIIDEIEKELNIIIPLDIKNFLLHYNGCKTDKYIIKNLEEECYTFNQIENMKDILEIIQIWRNDGYSMSTENQKILPFSRIGNTAELCFIFDKENNYQIGYFHVHDLEIDEETNTFDGLFYIIDNLENFLNLLKYPEDYTEPYLKIHDKFEIESEFYDIETIKDKFFNKDILGLVVYHKQYIFLKENNEFICYEQIKNNQYIKTNKTLNDFTYYYIILKINL